MDFGSRLPAVVDDDASSFSGGPGVDDDFLDCSWCFCCRWDSGAIQCATMVAADDDTVFLPFLDRRVALLLPPAEDDVFYHDFLLKRGL